MNGFEFGQDFENHKHRFNLVEVVEQKQLIKLVEQERVALAIMYREIVEYTVKSLAKSDCSIRRGSHVNSSYAFLAFSKKKHTDEIVKFLDKRLKKLKQTKRYNQLIN